MAEYATRLTNGQDTAARMRRSDALALTPSGNGTARTGLRPDGGGAVSINTGTMGVTVQPFTAWVASASSTQGGYPVVLDAAKVLAINPGHATLVRVDTVVAQVRDTTFDGSGSTDLRVLIVEGTPGAGQPALPTTSMPLFNINVPADASAGTGGLSGGALGTDRRTYVSGLGGVVTVANTTERDALLQIKGTVVYRVDADRLEVRGTSGWSPFTGQEALVRRDVATTMTFTNQTSYAVMNDATERTNMTMSYTKGHASTGLLVTFYGVAIGMTSATPVSINLGLRVAGTDYDVARGVGAGSNTYAYLSGSRLITGVAAGAVTIEPVFKASAASTLLMGNTYTTMAYTVREVR